MTNMLNFQVFSDLNEIFDAIWKAVGFDEIRIKADIISKSDFLGGKLDKMGLENKDVTLKTFKYCFSQFQRILFSEAQRFQLIYLSEMNLYLIICLMRDEKPLRSEEEVRK